MTFSLKAIPHQNMRRKNYEYIEDPTLVDHKYAWVVGDWKQNW